MKILAIVFAFILLSACMSPPVSAPLNTRSAMNVEAGLDRHKAKIFRAYRAFPHTEDARSAIKVVFEFVVEPDGSISRAKIINNQANSAALREQLLSVLKSFDFGALDVGPTDVTYSVDLETEQTH